jgi:hypothetical protein
MPDNEKFYKRMFEDLDSGVLCTCARVKIGGEVTDHLNWNPDCPVHEWSDRMQAQAVRAVELQLQAHKARREALEPKRATALTLDNGQILPGWRRGDEFTDLEDNVWTLDEDGETWTRK